MNLGPGNFVRAPNGSIGRINNKISTKDFMVVFNDKSPYAHTVCYYGLELNRDEVTKLCEAEELQLVFDNYLPLHMANRVDLAETTFYFQRKS